MLKIEQSDRNADWIKHANPRAAKADQKATEEALRRWQAKKEPPKKPNENH